MAIIETGNSTDVEEGGKVDFYDVRLLSPPTGNVTIRVLNNTQATALPSILVFTPANWSRPQSIKVTAINDTVTEGLHVTYFKHTVTSADPTYNGYVITDVKVNITDDDFLVFVREPNGRTDVTENGLADVYTVVLKVKPTKKVTVKISPSKQMGIKIGPSKTKRTLVFTAKNWNIPQTVVVYAKNDRKKEGRLHLGRITMKAISRDWHYNKSPVKTILASIKDND